MGGAQPLAATMAGASCLAVECQPSRIEMRLRTGYVDTQATRPRRGARDHRARLPGTKAGLGRPSRQRRRDLPGARAARRPARLRHRPDLGARSGQRLPADRLDARRMGGAARDAIRKARSQAAKHSMAEHVRAMLAFHGRGVPTLDYGNNIRQMAKDEGRRRRLRLPGLRAGLYPPALLPRHRAVPLGWRSRAIPRTSTGPTPR